MRIGYCSPLGPLRSGISDFSEELLPELQKYAEIVLFVQEEPNNKKIKESFEIHKIGELQKNELRNSLDFIVYHVGNNPVFHNDILDMLEKYPGIVEIHDIGLHDLILNRVHDRQGAEAYFAMAEYCHGQRGGAIAREGYKTNLSSLVQSHPLDMSMNRGVIEQATAVIVHSDFAKQMVLAVREDVPIAKIMLHAEEEPAYSDVKKCRQALDIPEDTIVMGAFGLATESKRILQTLEALKLFYDKIDKRFLYCIVGGQDEKLHLEDEVKRFGLEDNIRITGFLSLEEMKTYMGACDFCFNLRFPTRGESSASLHRMLGMGKPVIVTNLETFREYPDEIVLKVSPGGHETEEIYKAIRILTQDKKECRKRGALAKEYAKQFCSLEKNAELYAEFFKKLLENQFLPDYEDTLVGRLCDLNLTHETYTKYFYERNEDIWDIICGAE